MGFNLLDGIQGHADDDQERCSPKIEGDIESSVKNRWQDADGSHVNCSPEGDSRKHFIDIFSRLLSRTNARDITSKFFHIIGDIIWVEGNGRIKITEEEDESHVEKIVQQCLGAETLQNRINPRMGIQKCFGQKIYNRQGEHQDR